MEKSKSTKALQRHASEAQIEAKHALQTRLYAQFQEDGKIIPKRVSPPHPS